MFKRLIFLKKIRVTVSKILLPGPYTFVRLFLVLTENVKSPQHSKIERSTSQISDQKDRVRHLVGVPLKISIRK